MANRPIQSDERKRQRLCQWMFGPAAALLLAAFWASPPLSGQNRYPGPGGPGPMQEPMAPRTGRQMDPFERGLGDQPVNIKLLQTLNEDRQKSLVADTEKLVELAAELNAEVNGAHSASLTDDQMRLLDEIQKLAHSIRKKMCTAVNGNPQIAPAAFATPDLR